MEREAADKPMAVPERKKRVFRVGPRSELFESEAAAILFHGFLALGRIDQYRYADAVQRELTARQPRDTPSRKVEEAIRVLREAATLEEGSPSIKRYEALRRQHPEWRWPPSSSLRRWLGVGSWALALRRAALPTVLPGDALESDSGPAFTAEEAIVALTDCARELGQVPSFNAYVAWAHRDDVKRRPGRRPLGEGPFYRLFGSFRNALVAAGLAENGRSTFITANGQVRVAHYRVGDEQIVQALQEVAATLGHPPNSSEYIHTRETIFKQSLAEGTACTLPSCSTIMRRFVRWAEALAAAGLAAADDTTR